MRLSFISVIFISSIALCEGSSKTVIGYFPNWLYSNYTVESIPYKKYTHINYAFAILNSPDNLPSFSDDRTIEASLPKIVRMAHKNNTKVLLSVGGWAGSKRFSPMAARKSSRAKFIKWNLKFIEKYNTDGVDIDWEYPGKQGAGCNEVAHNDADNFLLLLKELRFALDTHFPQKHKEISMAVHVQPFIRYGIPMSDLQEFVPYFDRVNLMTYDINGAWASTTGPNAPFRLERDKGSSLSFTESIKQWKAAGVPSEKITAGLAFYGRAMKAKVNMVTDPTNQYQSSEVVAPRGDSDDTYWYDSSCDVEPGGLSGKEYKRRYMDQLLPILGVWKWSNLRKEGILMDDFITTGKDWIRHWDDVTQTPWLFNPKTQHYITYDDPQSLDIKIKHVLCEGLAGVMVWDIHQDNGELLDVVNKIHSPISSTTCQSIAAGNSPLINQESSLEIDDEYNYYENLEGWLIEGDVVQPTILSNQNPLLSSAAPKVSLASGTSKVSLASSRVPARSSNAPKVSSAAKPLSTTAANFAPKASASNQIEPNLFLAGQSCSIPGQQRCVKSGYSNQWATCNFNEWVVRECSSGLVCVDNPSENSFYCDLPSEKRHKHIAQVKAVKKSVTASSVTFTRPSSTAASNLKKLPVKNDNRFSLAVERPNEQAVLI